MSSASIICLLSGRFFLGQFVYRPPLALGKMGLSVERAQIGSMFYQLGFHSGFRICSLFQDVKTGNFLSSVAKLRQGIAQSVYPSDVASWSQGTVTLHMNVHRRAASHTLWSLDARKESQEVRVQPLSASAPLWLLSVRLLLASGHEAVFNAQDNEVLIAALRTLL